MSVEGNGYDGLGKASANDFFSLASDWFERVRECRDPVRRELMMAGFEGYLTSVQGSIERKNGGDLTAEEEGWRRFIERERRDISF